MAEMGAIAGDEVVSSRVKSGSKDWRIIRGQPVLLCDMLDKWERGFLDGPYESQRAGEFRKGLRTLQLKIAPRLFLGMSRCDELHGGRFGQGDERATAAVGIVRGGKENIRVKEERNRRVAFIAHAARGRVDAARQG